MWARSSIKNDLFYTAGQSDGAFLADLWGKTAETGSNR
jgi:hypothetical protein